MRYRSDPRADTPHPTKPKKLVGYAAAIKIYGLLPYLLNRRVQGEFRSSEPIGLVLPTWEPNYTLVPYAALLGRDATEALEAWLCADAGYEWGIAAGTHYVRPLRGNNAHNAMPPVVHLIDGREVEGYAPITNASGVVVTLVAYREQRAKEQADA